jgi:hypothetical protein
MSACFMSASSLRFPFGWRGNREGIPGVRVYGPSLAVNIEPQAARCQRQNLASQILQAKSCSARPTRREPWPLLSGVRWPI